MDYYALFEHLTDLMTSINTFDIPEIFHTLAKMCKILNISKGVTTFYENTMQEKRGEGESFVCYDSGEDHVLISSMRIVTPAQITIVCNVYQAAGAEPLSERDRKRVEIIQRMMLTYLNRARQEKIIEKLMYQDDDGYYNLRYFYAQIMKCKETGELKGKAAFRLNLKHFSMVNEQIGKVAGDAVLKSYCKKLEEAFQGTGSVCRLGGDNFVALFDAACLPEVEKCLEGLPIPIDGTHSQQRILVSSVAGICIIDHPEEILNPGNVMEMVITAYLNAKRNKTKDIMYYSVEMQEAKIREIRFRQKFESALKNEEFHVYFQPKVDIQTRQMVGAEALCRWIQDGEVIPPLEFIPMLERGDDICRLDFYMLDKVCKNIRRWLDQGCPVVRISVNLSRRHMTDPDLFEHIVEIIDRNKVPHALIEIELTETTTDVEFRDLKKVVNQLQKAGISASVDDFGIGYSSLNLIKQIPWDVLKLDKSILPVKDDEMERSNRMFAHVIAMAHEIGLKCVAEGVETEEQLEIMRHYGCRIAQGFLFDKPLPLKEFEKRMVSSIYKG